MVRSMNGAPSSFGRHTIVALLFGIMFCRTGIASDAAVPVRSQVQSHAHAVTTVVRIFNECGVLSLSDNEETRIRSGRIAEALSELRRDASCVNTIDSAKQRLHLVCLACSSGNLLLADVHLCKAKVLEPESPEIGTWRAILAATRYLITRRDRYLAETQEELSLRYDRDSVDNACALLVRYVGATPHDLR